jgi:hypothetical protein
MGKKKGSTSSSATTGAAKVGLDWCASTILKREENKMRSLGLISSIESDYLHPGSSSRPKPPKGFTIMFAAFLFRGLSLPAHEFLRSLLFFYGIQLWTLTPNSILHLSIFITLCEAFLGIDPTGACGGRFSMSNATMALMVPLLLAASASSSGRRLSTSTTQRKSQLKAGDISGFISKTSMYQDGVPIFFHLRMSFLQCRGSPGETL